MRYFLNKGIHVSLSWIDLIENGMNKKLKASSLIEVIVAMLIVTITFSMSLGVIYNTFSQNRLISKYYYHILAEGILNSSLLNGDFESKIIEQEGVIINKEVQDYQGIDNLYLINIEVNRLSGEKITGIKYVAQEKNEN